jgi:hypothetical protein
MKSLFTLAFCICSIIGYTQTVVSGGIFQNTVWNLAGSPYEVTGSIVIFPGNSLTIEPGVEIFINNSVSSSIYIETRGSLYMVGTDVSPIRIRAMYDTTNIGWKGFRCTSSQGGQLTADKFHIANAEIPFDYEAPPSLYQYNNCRFSRCGQAITVGNEVLLSNCQFLNNENAIYGWSYFTISDCLFQGNGTGINAYSTSFSLNNSSFIENSNAVVFSSGVFDTMTITDCSFLNNGVAINYPNNGSIENCLFLDNVVGVQGSYMCSITNNTFNYNELAADVSVLTELTNNQINNNLGGVSISGISASSNAPTISDNEICGNITYNVNNNTNVNYSLLSNCFCGLDSAQIEQYLIDGYDDITKGLINYQVYDSSCLNVLGTISKFNDLATLNEFLPAHLIFSNPVNEQLFFHEPFEINSIVLMNLHGKRFHIEPSGYNSFNLGNLSSGYYFLTEVNNYRVHEKIIKQ